MLHGVDLAVPAGRVTGLGGPSGSGKTTLARVLTGLLEPEAGQVTVDGEPLASRRGRMSGEVLMLFQSPRRSCNPHRTLRQLAWEPLTAGASGRTREAPGTADLVARAWSLAGLTDDLLDRLPGEVSLGQLQRVALARVLVAKPRYLICDEATAMLDALTTAALVDVLRGEVADGLGILAISHDEALLAAWADSVHDIRDLSRA